MKRENREAKTNDHQSTTQSTKQKSARFEELDQDQMSEIKGGMAKAEWRGRIGALGATGEATYHNRAPPSHRALPSFFFRRFCYLAPPPGRKKSRARRAGRTSRKEETPFLVS